jgi:hypothetical protein
MLAHSIMNKCHFSGVLRELMNLNIRGGFINPAFLLGGRDDKMESITKRELAYKYGKCLSEARSPHAAYTWNIPDVQTMSFNVECASILRLFDFERLKFNEFGYHIARVFLGKLVLQTHQFIYINIFVSAALISLTWWLVSDR